VPIADITDHIQISIAPLEKREIRSRSARDMHHMSNCCGYAI
jgi:hypothetical protein